MKFHSLRRALALAAFGGLCCSAFALPASASRHSHTAHRSSASRPPSAVTIRPGDTIERLARRRHVTVRDIARLNHIRPDTLLIDGHTLRIPAAPASCAAEKPRHARRPARVARHTAQAWLGANIVRTAFAYRGVAYRFGGTSRSGIDCSGFTGRVLDAQGVHLPRTAAEQFTCGKRIRGGELRPGDLVFFHTTRPGVSHVGIYVGGGRFVHASSAKGHVRTDTLATGYYHERLVGARRYR